MSIDKDCFPVQKQDMMRNFNYMKNINNNKSAGIDYYTL